MKLTTLTLCPAFDLHCYTEVFHPYHENLAEVTDFAAGGKGINIARALSANGIAAKAIVLLGEENRAAFEALLGSYGIDYLAIPVPGRIRENITLHEAKQNETRISFPGSAAGTDALETVEASLSDLAAGDIVTLTGRVAEGMDMEEVKAFCNRLKAHGARLVVDSRSFALADLLEVKPWLIKPNEEEISAYLGKEIFSLAEVKDASQMLVAKGIENVMITLGERGACLACEAGYFTVTAPKIEAVSTVGAGDSAIAGFLAATLEGASSLDCLKRSVAYGSAACLLRGTQPPRREDIEKFLG